MIMSTHTGPNTIKKRCVFKLHLKTGSKDFYNRENYWEKKLVVNNRETNNGVCFTYIYPRNT